MDNFVLSSNLRAQLTKLASNPPHAIVISGPEGIGKCATAIAWASQICKNPQTFSPDEKGTISIETIRSLYKQTRGKLADWQVVVIRHAQTMSLEAQNAFLKLLEEPRQGVVFVLTTAAPHLLLPTVMSRAYELQITPVPTNDLKKWLIARKPNLKSAEVAQLLFIAQGRPGILARILDDSQLLDAYREHMSQAKQLLNASVFERLTQIANLTNNRETLVRTLESMAAITKFQLLNNYTPELLKISDGLEKCLNTLAQNGNPRAQLMRFFMSY